MTSDIEGQFAFLEDIENLRRVQRNNCLLDGSRRENSAEHSWHLALYALILADHAPQPVNVIRIIQMLLLHDIVEIDVGDYPIHLDVNWAAVAAAEQKAATRIFGQLPSEKARDFKALWSEFEEAKTADAVFAKALDFTQPLMQVVYADNPSDEHVQICRDALISGRSKRLRTDFPEAYQLAMALVEGQPAAASDAFAARIRFLNEADKLKSILRASKIGTGARHENSAEHSWHILTFAWVLSQYASQPIEVERVITMLLLHDLVEIDAGDTPIHGSISTAELAALEASELAAARRIFGLLPDDQGAALLEIWQEFEAAQSADAVFAKAIDRVQPVLLNLKNGGGSWVDYHVTLPQLETRVGEKVTRGAPEVWQYVRARVLPWFQENNKIQ